MLIPVLLPPLVLPAALKPPRLPAALPTKDDEEEKAWHDPRRRSDRIATRALRVLEVPLVIVAAMMVGFYLRPPLETSPACNFPIRGVELRFGIEIERGKFRG